MRRGPAVHLIIFTAKQVKKGEIASERGPPVSETFLVIDVHLERLHNTHGEREGWCQHEQHVRPGGFPKTEIMGHL